MEREFPLAFGILIYKEFDQFEQLFRLIHRRYNFHCIHVDAKSDSTFKAKVRRNKYSCQLEYIQPA